MKFLDALRIPEFQFGDFLVPWGMVIGTLGFLAAWFSVIALEQAGWTRRIWHLPLFFVALAVLFGCTFGLLFAP
jgi:hypothetical protein